ncbi:MAG: hypothetical protein R2724_05430 [Bryobacterales bacterium]
MRKAGIWRVTAPQPVHGYVIKGKWRISSTTGLPKRAALCLRTAWRDIPFTCQKASRVVTMFQVNGIMNYVDPWGKNIDCEDVFTKDRHVCQALRVRARPRNFVQRFIR